VKLSAKDGEVRPDHAVESWSNIKLQLMNDNGEELPGDLYAKVMGGRPQDAPWFVVHCTSIPPQVAMFFERLLAAHAS